MVWQYYKFALYTEIIDTNCDNVADKLMYIDGVLLIIANLNLRIFFRLSRRRLSWFWSLINLAQLL